MPIALKKFSFILIFIFLTNLLQAQNLTGTWLNPKATTKIEIVEIAAGKYQGKLVWADVSRPDLKTFYGYNMLENVKKTGVNKYEGKIRDPRKNKTYSCIINVKGNSMILLGYIGVTMFGKSQTWKRVTN